MQRTDSQGGRLLTEILRPDYQPDRVFIFAILILSWLYIMHRRSSTLKLYR